MVEVEVSVLFATAAGLVCSIECAISSGHESNCPGGPAQPRSPPANIAQLSQFAVLRLHIDRQDSMKFSDALRVQNTSVIGTNSIFSAEIILPDYVPPSDAHRPFKNAISVTKVGHELIGGKWAVSLKSSDP